MKFRKLDKEKRLLNLFKQFIDKYVRTPDFIAAFDERMFSSQVSWYYGVMKTQSSRTGGNQIIITSRIVGYRLYPIDSSLIEHYSLSLMNHEEAKKFAKIWITQVEKSIFNIFLMKDFYLTKKQ